MVGQPPIDVFAGTAEVRDAVIDSGTESAAEGVRKAGLHVCDNVVLGRLLREIYIVRGAAAAFVALADDIAQRSRGHGIKPLDAKRVLRTRDDPVRPDAKAGVAPMLVTTESREQQVPYPDLAGRF